MKKKLSKFGNSLALIIEKPILKLLDINENTILKIRTDGKKITITPVEDATEDVISKDPRVQKSVKSVMEKYSKAFEKLAKK